MALDPRIFARLSAQEGVGAVSEMGEMGLSRHVAQRSIAAGQIIRLRRNVVALAEVWAAAAP